MTRSLTSSIKTELATNDIRPVHLITIGFSTPVNITDCSFSLTSSVSGSSVTYNPSDFIMGVSDFTEETDVTKTSLNIDLCKSKGRQVKETFVKYYIFFPSNREIFHKFSIEFQILPE